MKKMERQKRSGEDIFIYDMRRKMWGPLLMGIMMVGADCPVNTQISRDDEIRISVEREPYQVVCGVHLYNPKVSNYWCVWVDDDYTLIGVWCTKTRDMQAGPGPTPI